MGSAAGEFWCGGCAKHRPLSVYGIKRRTGATPHLCSTCYENLLKHVNASEKQRLMRGRHAQRKYAQGQMPLSDEDAH